MCAMPNTNPAVVDEKSLIVAKERAARKARCDYALMMGASSRLSHYFIYFLQICSGMFFLKGIRNT